MVFAWREMGHASQWQQHLQQPVRHSLRARQSRLPYEDKLQLGICHFCSYKGDKTKRIKVEWEKNRGKRWFTKGLRMTNEMRGKNETLHSLYICFTFGLDLNGVWRVLLYIGAENVMFWAVLTAVWGIFVGFWARMAAHVGALSSGHGKGCWWGLKRLVWVAVEWERVWLRSCLLFCLFLAFYDCKFFQIVIIWYICKRKRIF